MIYYRPKDHPSGEDVILSTAALSGSTQSQLLTRGYTRVDSTDCDAQAYIMAAVAAYYPEQAGLSAVRKSAASTIKHIQEQDLDP